MHLHNKGDQGFDAFRRERKRVKTKLGSTSSVLGYENPALRELEQVEEREVRDQQLSREVHDFFAAATRQAAAIVEKVAHDAEEEAGERMQGEVQTFLMDTLNRMNGFIMSVMQQQPNSGVAEAHIEPDVKHLVGTELDEFRNQGSAETFEAHLGQDPFATDLEDVRAEFRAVVADMGDEQPSVASIDQHLVAETAAAQLAEAVDEMVGEEVAEADYDEPVAAEEAAYEEPAAEQVVEQPPQEPMVESPFDQTTHSELDADGEPMSVEEVLDTFKNALKALVRQGVMHREEARAAWNARLVALGRAKG